MSEEGRERPAPLDAEGLQIGVVAARFNEAVVERLVAGASDALVRHGARASDLHLYRVPGSFEIPVVLRRLAESGRFDALVAVAAIVRGATPHFDHVARETIAGIAVVARETGVPVGLGVLTTDTWEQAVERAGGKLGNKGAEAALSALETANLLRDLKI